MLLPQFISHPVSQIAHIIYTDVTRSFYFTAIPAKTSAPVAHTGYTKQQQ